jgi:DNA primase
MIPYETVDKIIDTARIEEVVGDFVTLKRRGANYTACCPFHNEKTPSFYVSPSKGIYKCFGCGKSGTAVGFVMEHESLSYVEALKYLAKKYHIEIIEEEESAEQIAQRQRNESLLLVSEYAGQFFKDSLMTQEGQTIGYQYFRSRGLQDETIRKYGLGWAPKDRSSFSDKARAEGYKEEFLTETGLSIKYDDGRLVDRFSDRVIFPIHSVSGRVIGFGGRTLLNDKSVAKYLNSPTSEIYDKRHTLYGIYFAKSEMSRQDKCILVEGYLDVLSMHQLGITNVVASSGTSLTVEQIRLIRKFTNNVTIIYDGDAAGIKAALRGIGLVLKEGLNVKVVLLPEGQDPDDFARKHTLEQVQDHITRTEQDFISFKTDLLLGEAGGDPLKKAALINDIADTIALIPDAVIRAVYVHSCSGKFEVDEQILSDRVNRSRTDMLVAEQKQKEREEERTARMAAAGQNRVSPNQGEVPPPVDYPGYDAPPAEYDAPPIGYDAPPVGYDGMPSEYGAMPTPDYMSNGYGVHGAVSVQDPMYMQKPSLEPCEKEILGFILEHGCAELLFDIDSRFYVQGETVNVAEFIDSIMAEDEAVFFNEPYRKVYDEYFRMYDEGLTQEQIQSRLLNSMDPVLSTVAKDLLIEKYQITVKNYESSLTAVSTRLVQFVPRALMTYQCKKVELILQELTMKLQNTQDEAEMEEILRQISDYNRARTRLNNELGRV